MDGGWGVHIVQRLRESPGRGVILPKKCGLKSFDSWAGGRMIARLNDRGAYSEEQCTWIINNRSQ